MQTLACNLLAQIYILKKATKFKTLENGVQDYLILFNGLICY